MFLNKYSTPFQSPFGCSCARTRTIHLALVAVPFLWMREGSWWRLSTIGRAWGLAVVLSTRGGENFIPIGGSKAQPFVTRRGSRLLIRARQVDDLGVRLLLGQRRTTRGKEPIIVVEMNGLDRAVFI
jgi:hypothetical protein